MFFVHCRLIWAPQALLPQIFTVHKGDLSTLSTWHQMVTFIAKGTLWLRSPPMRTPARPYQSDTKLLWPKGMSAQLHNAKGHDATLLHTSKGAVTCCVIYDPEKHKILESPSSSFTRITNDTSIRVTDMACAVATNGEDIGASSCLSEVSCFTSWCS